MRERHLLDFDLRQAIERICAVTSAGLTLQPVERLHPARAVQPEQDGDRDICGRPPGAAFVPPGEVIDVRLEDV